MPFGINVAHEELQRRIDENLEGLEGVKTIADEPGVMVTVMVTQTRRQ